ncbi:adenosylcobinamide-phosphate synthase CbiB [Butyrivibrio sp. JL13D10]|uniref:adenosylcobinamide-phosphate synthase CbiB n=1 Tax=Butyrivibrio sp. JL13D10 TaxID=3236815 RepID=UPI0038B43D48
MKYHLISFVMGFFLDLIIGDPMNFPHPIRLIGNLIGLLDRKLLGETENKKRNAKAEFFKGIVLFLIVIICTALITGVVIVEAYRIHPYVGVVTEAILTCYILAARSLRDESMKVHDALLKGSIEDGRYAVSMIVGRDTASLDEAGIARAAVETVAENTSDGIIAPLIYTFIGGPVLGFTYKAINTMDSMVGYHNNRYEHFGTAAAKADDVVNYIPARISGLLMILAAYIGGSEYSGRGAFKIFCRDRYNHKSPNSAQTEAACAGALSLRLAGDAYYFGKLVKKPFIGDDIRHVEPEDIKRACRLMFVTEFLCMLILIGIGIFFYMIQ